MGKRKFKSAPKLDWRFELQIWDGIDEGIVGGDRAFAFAVPNRTKSGAIIYAQTFAIAAWGYIIRDRSLPFAPAAILGEMLGDDALISLDEAFPETDSPQYGVLVLQPHKSGTIPGLKIERYCTHQIGDLRVRDALVSATIAADINSMAS